MFEGGDAWRGFIIGAKIIQTYILLLKSDRQAKLRHINASIKLSATSESRGIILLRGFPTTVISIINYQTYLNLLVV